MENKPTFEELEQRILELEKREKRNRMLFDRMNSGFAIHEIIVNESGKPIDYVFLEVNNAFESLTGLSRNAVLQKKVTEVIPGIENDPFDWIGKYGKVALSGQGLNFEHYSVQLGRWFSVRAFSPEKGQFVTIVEDVTDKRMTEEALRKTSESLQAILDNSPLLISEFDLDGRYIRVNEAVARLLQRSSSDLVGKAFSEILPADEADVFMKRIELVSNTRHPITVEDHLVTQEGYQHFITTVFPLFDASGHIRSIGGIAHNITERKSGQEALKEKEALLNRSQKIASMGSFIWDLRNDSLVWSKNMYAIHGLSEASFTENLTEMMKLSIHPADRDRVRMEIEKMVEVGHVMDMEFRIVLPHGEERFMRSSGEFELDESGKPIKCLGIHQDITERKRAEETLRKSKSRFERMLNVVPDLISIHDPEMNILYSNWQGFGAISEERRRLNTKCYNTYRGFDSICPDCKAKEVIDSGRSLQEEVELPDGTWVDLRVIPIIDNEGNIEMFMEWVRDITHKKQFQLELQSQKRLLEGVLDSIKDVIGVQMPDHTVLQYNRAGYELLGLTEDDIMGKKCYELIGRNSPCKMCATAECYLSKTIETVEKFVPELGRYFLCTSNPVLDEQGNIKLIIEQLTDITDQKKSDERLRQAQKLEAIGSLAGGIAHDFNNILFPIVGMSEMLLEDLPAGSPEKDNAEEIFRAGKRGSDLVNQILAFSRQSEHKMVPTRVQHILKEVLKLSRSTIPAYIDIQQQIQSDCGMIMADPTQIHQVAMNLITNAYHAMEDEGGKLTIKLKQVELSDAYYAETGLEPGKYALLSISDTGHGISDEFILKIFDPYFTTKKQGKGTGLGLAVVYGIVQEHDGTIKVQSEIGQGSTFDVYFPLMDKPDREESAKQVEDYLGGNERILLVDDEEPIAKLEKQMLERLGYKVTMRFSSLDALEVFKSDPHLFDLVISDMTMPGMTGDRLARELTAISPNTPIIICTGFSERLNKEKAATIGIKGFLMKPIVKSEMAKMVRKVLDEDNAEKRG